MQEQVMVLSISLDALSRFKVLLGILILVFPVMVSRAQVVHPEGVQVVGEMTVLTVNGVDVNPGSDADADLLTVGVTGAPTFWWDESADLFTFTHAILANTSIAIDNLLMAGNTLSSTDTNGNVVIAPDGTGVLSVTSQLAVGDGDGHVTETISGASITSSVSAHSESGTDPGGVSVNRHTDSNALGGHFLSLRSRGTHATPTVVQDNDIVTRVISVGHDGTDYEMMTEIRSTIDGTPGDGDMPGRLGFFTTPDGGNTPLEALQIGQDQNTNLLGAKELRFQDTTGGEYIGFKAPGTVTASTTFTWPDGDGTSGQALITDAAGTLSWGDAGGGGGGTGLNYIKNTDYEIGSGDVTVTANITKALETTDPLRGAQSLKLTIGTGATTADYADLDMNDIDNFDQDGSMMLNVAFDYETDANFTADDVQVVLRRLDATAADIILHDNLDGKILASSKKIRFTSRVQVDSDANTYAIRINVLSAPGTASNLYIDNVFIGPDTLTPGSIVTDWQDYTPTSTWVSNVTHTGKWRRVGEDIELEIKLSVTGAPTVTNLIIHDHPVYPVDTTNYEERSPAVINFIETGVRNYLGGGYYGTAGGGWTILNSEAGNAGVTNASNPFVFGTGDFINMTVKYPVAEWQSGASLSTFEQAITTVKAMMKVTSGSHTSTGNWQSLAAGTAVIDIIKDDFGVLSAGGVFTAPRTGWYLFVGDHEFGLNVSGQRGGRVTLTGESAGNYQGSFTAPVGSFGSISSLAHAAYMKRGDTGTFEGFQNSGGNLAVTDTRYSVVELPDYSNTSTYGEEESVSSYGILGAVPGASSSYGNVTTILLTPGKYLIGGSVEYKNTGAASAIYHGLAYISVNSGTSVADLDAPRNSRRFYMATDTSAVGTAYIPAFRITITEDTTYYLKAAVTSSGSTNITVEQYGIIAERIQ
jgi:hypothetical protein